jgi:hypothetical protein
MHIYDIPFLHYILHLHKFWAQFYESVLRQGGDTEVDDYRFSDVSSDAILHDMLCNQTKPEINWNMTFMRLIAKCGL